MSLDLFCIVALLIFLFGFAFGINEPADYPRKIPEPWYVDSIIDVEEE